MTNPAFSEGTLTGALVVINGGDKPPTAADIRERMYRNTQSALILARIALSPTAESQN